MASVYRPGNFSTRNGDVYIVNNYNSYGHSVFHSRSALSQHSQQSQRTDSQQSRDSHGVAELIAEAPVKRPKFGYKSLLIQDSKVKRFLNKLDPDSFSLFSSRAPSLATISSLPTELLTLTISYVGDYKSTISCLYVNKSFSRAAKPVVYHAPVLHSTYRVAQLVSSLREFDNGQWIRCLDLSQLEPGLISDEGHDAGSINSSENGIEYALASWRDWKYKDDPLYGSALMNSYNLSKSKSTMSYDSQGSTNSLSRIFTRFKSSDMELEKFRSSLRRMFSKLNRKSNKSKISKVISHQLPGLQVHRAASKNSQSREVKWQVEDLKNQPFSSGHPYTNKFLLKYANSKDLPIGHILYLLELCPNLLHLDLSNMSLSEDFQISCQKPSINSLIESVLENSTDDSMKSNYLSDNNVHFNVHEQSHIQFKKLQELDIVSQMCQLKKLSTLSLSNVSWLNYRIIHGLSLQSKSVLNGRLQKIDFTNSGMMRGLGWARVFEELREFKEYFAHEVELIVEEEEDEFDILVRGIGMNY